MSKKLQGNGLFESSRMMLFEHRDALIERHRLVQKRSRRELDEQRREELAARLGAAMAERAPVKLTLFHEDGDRIVRGVITRHDAERLRVRVGREWISLQDIVDCE
jgi:hypothetical protein